MTLFGRWGFVIKKISEDNLDQYNIWSHSIMIKFHHTIEKCRKYLISFVLMPRKPTLIAVNYLTTALNPDQGATVSEWEHSRLPPLRSGFASQPYLKWESW